VRHLFRHLDGTANRLYGKRTELRLGKPLEIEQRAVIASEMAYRCQVHHEAWFAIANRDNRKKYRDVLDEHAEILVLTQAAHLVALVCTLHALFETAAKRLSLPNLSKELGGLGASELAECLPICSKVEKLRHKLYAHRAPNLSREQIFDLAAITPNELGELARRAVEITDLFIGKLGLPDVPKAIGARAGIENLLDALARDYDSAGGLLALRTPM
jgi:hypothetical protein